MPRMPDVLEGASRSVDLEQGDFERLLGRRERKQRNRRIRAGVLGVVVALVTGAILVRSLTLDSIPADPPTPTQLGAGEVLTVRSGDLVAQDPDSGEVRTIVAAETLPEREGTPKSITGAAWSPDRKWVAFRANGLFVADSVGGEPRQITEDQAWFPWAWSPTDDHLAFVQGGDVSLIDVATGRETDLGTVAGPEDSEGYAVHALVWSPDGTRIAYDGGPGSGSVYSIDVESGEHSLLVGQPAGTGWISDIDWSPDGAYLAIYYDEKALYLANADGSDLRLLDRVVATQWPVWHPGLSVGTAWSPDGTRLAYASSSGSDHGGLQLWTVSVDGSAPRLVASDVGSDGGGPVWSPDGSRIAFEVEPPGDQPHHYLVVNADGTGDPGEIDELTYRSWLGGWDFCRCYG